MKRILYFVFIAIVILSVSCSTQKNTLISRSYHNLTAKYNVLFNGKESYKKGVKKIEDGFTDDYSRILPVFKYGNAELAASASSEMDVAIRKSSKMITLHSIKAKPEIKKGKRLSADEKEFMNRNEYNKWVDDAYMLVGKSHMYKQDYPNAIQSFNFVIREFPKEPAQYMAKIFLARVYTQTKGFNDAESLISSLESDKKFPKQYKLDLLTTKADFFIRQNKYLPAIKALENAIELTHKKKPKLRYLFILAQLYQQTGQSQKAAETYLKVIRKNPPYEMTFNARINLAGSISADSKNNREIRKSLEKMLRDNKNIDFRDQIYFALGNIEMNEGNKNAAIEYYEESVRSSTKNEDQKALTCLTLANMYYEDKKYVPAQAYYDSTLMYIDEDYPEIETFKAKAANLNKLVENLNTISREDSLQRIARLPEASRMRVIDNIINDIRVKESEAQQAESMRLQEYYNNQSRLTMPGTENTAKWYFYNPVSVAQGMREFQLRWGKRKLEDNWRRRNKSIASGESADLAFSTQANDTKKVLDNKSREYYIQNLPLNDSLMEVSGKMLTNAYFNAGIVYHTDLNDVHQAIAIFEKMITRLPENEYIQSVYYQLYSMYREINNEAKAFYYRNLLITKYPESNFARIMTDPDFYKQLQKKEKEVDDFYELTYNLYNTGDYQQVISNAQAAFNKYKNSKLLPRFALLKAFAVGKTSDKMAFRDELNRIIANYPEHEVSSQAKEMIAYLNAYQPETKQQEEIKTAEVIYNAAQTAPFYFALVVDKNEDINQLVFDIINFNLDNFTDDKLEINNEALGKDFKVITIQSFRDTSRAMAYYKAIGAKPEVFKNIKNPAKYLFVITQENYQVLRKQETADSYLQFFKLHFK